MSNFCIDTVPRTDSLLSSGRFTTTGPTQTLNVHFTAL